MSRVCIITRSTSASLLLKGLATKHTTVKFTIGVTYKNSKQTNSPLKEHLRVRVSSSGGGGGVGGMKGRGKMPDSG